MTALGNLSVADLEKILFAAEEEPLHAKLDFPYYIRMSLMYTGSSQAKGAEWLAMVDRKVVKLKERKCGNSTISKEFIDILIPLPAP